MTEKNVESPIEQMMFEIMVRGSVDYISTILPQHEIGPFRVDFLLVPSHKKFIGVVVECDGDEFHGSMMAKERDAKRDEYIKGQGYKIIHFTGSEIYNNRNNVELACQVKRLIMDGIEPYKTGKVFVEIIDQDGNNILVPSQVLDHKKSASGEND